MQFQEQVSRPDGLDRDSEAQAARVSKDVKLFRPAQVRLQPLKNFRFLPGNCLLEFVLG